MLGLNGDGDQIYCCWHLFLPYFVVYRHAKYALQALRLQFQVKGYLSQHLSFHVLWDRFINTKGGAGKNMPCDLYNEHINKLLKEIIANMGPNLTEQALRCTARSVTSLHIVCQNCNQVYHSSQVVIPQDLMQKTLQR